LEVPKITPHPRGRHRLRYELTQTSAGKKAKLQSTPPACHPSTMRMLNGSEYQKRATPEGCEKCRLIQPRDQRRHRGLQAQDSLADRHGAEPGSLQRGDLGVDESAFR